MKVEISKSEIFGEIIAPSSKSYAQRLIILSAFSGKEIQIENVEFSTDVKASINFIKSLGAICEINGDTVKIKGIKTPPSKIRFEVKDCGFTLRTAIAVCYILGINAEIICEKALLSRPTLPLITALNGEKDIIKTNCGYKINGICDKISTLDGSESSQYVSATLIGLALRGGGQLKVLNAVSRDYINITQDCLRKFGYNCTQNGDTFTVIKTEKEPLDIIRCEGDWTNASVMLALGILGEVKVKGLNFNSVQGDKRIVEILKKAGLEIITFGDEIISRKKELRHRNYDVSENVDLAIILSAVMSTVNGKSTIKGIKRLKIKESNRESGIIEIIEKFGGSAESFNNEIVITDKVTHGANVSGNGDHRIVMAETLYGLMLGDTVITGAECVEKSYPKFFEDVKMLGGKINVKD